MLIKILLVTWYIISIINSTYCSWDNWTVWTDCSKDCDSGIRTRSRSCSTASCSGESGQSEACNIQACSVTTPRPHVTCNRSLYKKIGCTPRIYTGQSVVINDMDFTPDPDGKFYQISWTNYQQSLHSLVCRCVKFSKALRRNYFAINFWGECWSSNSVYDLDSFKSMTNMNHCMGPNPTDLCVDAGVYDCSAKDPYSYIYEIVDPIVDGQWGAWQETTECSADCLGGTKQRTRSCDHPPPMNNGNDCVGASTETMACNLGPCTTGSVHVTCNRTNYRKVGCYPRVNTGQSVVISDMDVFPDPNGKYYKIVWQEYPQSLHSVVCRCAELVKSRRQNYFVINHWGECWSSKDYYGLDTIKAGQEQESACIGPNYSDSCKNNGAFDCTGVDPYSYLYKIVDPIVDGQWGAWQDATECSVDCLGGTKKRTRSCDHPPPMNNGSDCVGNSADTVVCNTGSCTSSRPHMTCNRTTYKKVGCYSRVNAGQSIVVNHMDAQPDVDGKFYVINWFEYQQSLHTLVCRCADLVKAMHQNYFVINYWGECWSSANYYDLDMVKSGQIGDSCRGPEPFDICSDHTNFECTGKDPYSYLYEIVNPIVDGQWNNWGNWLECSADCLGGTKQRTRSCDHPPPMNNGSDCIGASTETMACNLGPCTVPRPPSSCDRSNFTMAGCFPRVYTRQALVLSDLDWKPDPDGKFYQIIWPKYQQSLHSLVCRCAAFVKAMHQNYFTINYWGECWSSPQYYDLEMVKAGINDSSMCIGPGAVDVCNDSHNLECSGKELYSYVYEIVEPIVDGVWSEWETWSNCNSDCLKNRTRKCDNPPPMNNGSSCSGNYTEIADCKVTNCAVNGSWSQWSVFTECSQSCGGGVKNRTRTCTNPVPAFGGLNCSGNYTDVQACNQEACSYTTIICWNHIVTLSCRHGNHISVLSSASSESSSSCNNSITHRNETFLITDEIKLVCENHQNCTLNPVKLLTWKQTAQHIEVHHTCLPDEKLANQKIICNARPGQYLTCLNSSISILSANYGRTSDDACQFGEYTSTSNCRYNVMEEVRDLCEGRGECFLEINKKRYLDTCRGVTKYLEVNYTCIESTIKRDILCANTLSQIACNSSFISIRDVFFGRRNHFFCGRQSEMCNNTISDKMIIFLKKHCDGEHICSIDATTDKFGRKCTGISSYMDISYDCVEKV